jgi:Helix-turn-helix of DDE superfamily endonuclease
MTGLRNKQLTELVTRVHAACGTGFASRGRPYALGLFSSVALVVCLLRNNITQEFAGAIFGVSQATVSRRWDLLRPVIDQVLAEFIPDAGEVVGAGTVLVDGTICPTWD